MASDDENQEITVRAPSKPVGSPEKRAGEMAERALEEERFSVLEFPKKIGKYAGVVVAVMGVLLLSLFAYMSVTGQTGGILLSSGSGLASLVVWGFVGLLNIFVGFLFLGRE
jgi:uncharacterized protein YbjT (DUF2867 family)